MTTLLAANTIRYALLIIDVQKGLFGPSPKPYQVDQVIDNINQLITKAERNNVPVIYIQHEHKSYLPYQADVWQIYQPLNTIANGYYIRKTTPDSFLNTELLKLLQRLAVNQLVVCGYASEFCVDTTIRRAAALGYPVILAKDAHTTHDKPHANASAIIEHHTCTLTDLTSFGVTISALASNDIQF